MTFPKRLVALLSVSVTVVAACARLETPWTYSDFPCTPAGKLCPGGKCCSLDDACGGAEPGCPEGMCCYAPVVSGFAASHAPHPQWQAPR